jgi:cytochrome b subunit of formate dehydrogenase
MPENDQIPDGYRQSVTTAITVSLGFSLTFLKIFWALERKGGWSATEVASELIIVVGIILQVAALFRALNVLDNQIARYRSTVRCFQAGAVAVIVGVLISVFLPR